MTEIPLNTTIRQEYVKCGNPDCRNSHGPSMTIANSKHFSYDNENDLVDFISSQMQKEGLDLNNEENLDSYLNTKFM
jgi:hypothetical protein